ncbi:MAG: MATE family efflux transporter [Pelistega sp.]|nr:MATE family efflux transporter [Pelistega sp.]
MQLIKLALPLMFIQLCQASLSLIDTLMAGRFHYADLAAVGLGSAVWSTIYILLVGILYVLVPKFAKAQTLEQGQERKQLFEIAKKLAIQLACVGTILVIIAANLIGYVISDAEVANIAILYLWCIAFAMPALVAMSMLRFVCEGHKKLNTIMQVSILLLTLNFAFSYVMVNGVWFIPALGGVGCGIGTVISAYICLWYLLKQTKKVIPELFVSKKVGRDITFKDAVLLLKEGLPIGIALVLQILALAIIAFSAASLGSKFIAAHQIMINIAMCIVMIPLALGSASTIQVSINKSIKNNALRNTLIGALSTFVLYSLFIIILLSVGHKTIILLFTLDKDVQSIASSVLLYFMGFLVFDSLQMVLGGILRGFEEFIRPLLGIVIAYWLIALPLLFVFQQGWFYELNSLAKIWQAIMVGILTASLYLLTSLFSVYRKHQKKFN